MSAAEVLAAHRWSAVFGGCACQCGVPVYGWPAHALAELAEAGFAVVKLPEADGVETDSDEEVTYWSGPESPYGCASVKVLSGDLSPGISLNFPEWTAEPSVARDLAAALLAAAKGAQA